MSRVAVTGASGFVGQQVVRALIADGHRVRAIVRDGSAEVRSHPSVEREETLDLFAEPKHRLQSMLQGCDAVIHLAWSVSTADYLDAHRNMDCLEGTLRLARASVEAGLRRFVGIGTCFEYDLRAGEIDEQTPLAPTTLYATTKAAAYTTLSRYFADCGVKFTWCRLFYLHGEGEHPRRFVPYLRDRLSRGAPAELSSGTQIRDYLDVRVAGARIARVLGADHEGPLNICSGRGITIRAMAESIADEYGRRDLLHFGARADNSVDPPVIVGRTSWRETL
jgi:dTDP-6-deoxy-L-talose 4-dehydrogenase (NAD+)